MWKLPAKWPGMYDTGALIEDPEMLAVRADEAYQSRLTEFEAALERVPKKPAKGGACAGRVDREEGRGPRSLILGKGKVAVLPIVTTTWLP